MYDLLLYYGKRINSLHDSDQTHGHLILMLLLPSLLNMARVGRSYQNNNQYETLKGYVLANFMDAKTIGPQVLEYPNLLQHKYSILCLKKPNAPMCL